MANTSDATGPFSNQEQRCVGLARDYLSATLGGEWYADSYFDHLCAPERVPRSPPQRRPVQHPSFRRRRSPPGWEPRASAPSVNRP